MAVRVVFLAVLEAKLKFWQILEFLSKEMPVASKTVKVIARITALSDQCEAMALMLMVLVEPTRKEEGCINYQFLQNTTDPGDFTFVEEWVSGSAIDAHLLTPYVHEAFSRAKPLLAKEPDIRRYSVLDAL